MKWWKVALAVALVVSGGCSPSERSEGSNGGAAGELDELLAGEPLGGGFDAGTAAPGGDAGGADGDTGWEVVESVAGHVAVRRVSESVPLGWERTGFSGTRDQCERFAELLELVPESDRPSW